MNIVNPKKITKDQAKVYEAFNRNQLTQAEATNTKNKFFNDISSLPEVYLESITYSSKLPNRELVPKIKYTTSDTQSEETPYDGRLGSDESRVVCDTCKQVCNNCTGHMGIIELPFLLAQPYYRDYLIRVLRCICINCYSFILTKDAMISEGIGLNLKGFTRLSKIAMISDKRSCPNGHKNVIFKQTEASSNKTHKIKYYIKTTDKTERSDHLSIPKVKAILQEADKVNGGFKLLGFENDTSPLDFIDDYIPVISKSSRPRSFKDGIAKDDLLTSQGYNQIISKLNSGSANVKDEILFIYSHLMNNVGGDFKGPNEAKEPIVSIKDRITGKTRLIRGFMLSTRTNYSGRTVAGCKAKLKYGEISPPKILASEIQKAEVVTKYNIERIKNLVMEGKVVCFKPDIKKDYWKTVNEKYLETIEPGNVVRRWTVDGDIIIGNRQPTLHRQSMIHCRVKFLGESKICGVHLANTKGLNMDYDGDEVNMHVLQTSDAEIEGRTFSSIETSINSYTSPGVIAGLSYNALAGIYLLSVKDIKEQEFKILLRELNDYPDMKLKAKNLALSGMSFSKALISCMFLDDYSFHSHGVIIKNGIYISGDLTSKITGDNGSGSLLTSLCKWYNSKVLSDFISVSSFLGNQNLQLYGMTVSLKDIELDAPGPDGEPSWIMWKEKILNEINQEVLDMPIILNPTQFEKNERESDISTYIIGAKTQAVSSFIVKTLSKDNPLKILNTSGAKGKTENLIAIISHVGAQLVNNERPHKTLSHNQRWRHTFSINDRSIYSQGFIRNSYYKGLNQDEYWANAQSSRIGLIDTPIKTADIGAIERRMVKAMEDLCGDYDGTIRNRRGAIFQYSYGLGFSPDKMVIDKRKKIFFIDLDEALFKVNSMFEN